MVKREIISLHLGQAGIQVANALWEIYCIEHNVDPDGFLLESGIIDETSYETFFERTENNRFVPRAVFFDTECNVIDEIVTGPYRQLYHPLQLMKGCEDAANNFARGCFAISKRHMYDLMERVRRAMEISESVEGFMLTHSLGGGTGSGFGAVVSRILKTEFSKTNLVQLAIFPGEVLSCSIVEPYNTSLHIESTIDAVDLSLAVGNEALYDMCSNLLFQVNPNYSDINRLTALVVSASLAPLRFKGELNNDLGELQTNLVPYPRVHYPLMRYAPIFHYTKTRHLKPSILSITRDVFETKYQTIRADTSIGRFISVALNYRGNVSQRDINQAIQQVKMLRTVDFVDWCPTGFKVGYINSLQSVVPASNIALFDYTVSMIANTTAIKNAWTKINRRYMTLYSKKAFVHWFLDEGMELSEFEQASENLLTLIEDYDECCMSNEEMMDHIKRIEDSKSGKISRQRSTDRTASPTQPPQTNSTEPKNIQPTNVQPQKIPSQETEQIPNKQELKTNKRLLQSKQPQNKPIQQTYSNRK